MKYSEAKKEIEALSSKYNAYKDKHTDYFNVFYKNEEVAYLKTDKRYSVTVWSENNFTKLPFSNKLFMIMSELAMTPLDKRVEEKRHYIKMFNNSDGFLNIDTDNGKMSVCDSEEFSPFKTKFTDKEIEELKARDDVAIDWNKAHILDVEED